MPTTSRRIVFNSVVNVSSTIGRAAIGFFLLPFLVSMLGAEVYGVWVLIGSVLIYAPTLTLGLESAINRHVPVFAAQEDAGGIDRVVTTGSAFCAAAGVVILASTFIVHRNLDAWFLLPEHLQGSARTLLLVVGILIAVSMPLRPYSAVLSGLQHYGVLALGPFVVICLRAVALVWALLSGHGLLAVGAIFAASELLVVVTHALFARRALGRSALVRSALDFGLLREMLAYGINTFLYITATVILLKGSELVIGVLLGPAEITRFVVMMAPLLLLSTVVQASNAVIKPAVSDLDARAESCNVRLLSMLTQKYTLLMLLPGIFFLVVLGGDFLVLWMGPEFEGLALMLALLAVGHLIRLSQYSSFLVLVGKGEHKIFGILAVSVSATAMLLAVLAVKVLNLGLLGMVTANVVPMIITYGGVLPVYYCRKMGIPFSEVIRSVLVPALAGCLPAFALTVLWRLYLPLDSWGRLLIMIGSVIGVWLVSSWTLALTQEERVRFLRMTRRATPQNSRAWREKDTP